MESLIIGLAAGGLTTIAFLPQVIKVFKTKKAKDLSLITFSVFSLGIFLWLIYGLLIQDPPVIIANAVTLILALLIVIMRIKYG